MSKHIIFCADGTWNSPQQDGNKDHTADPTNVYKLFKNLDGQSPPDTLDADLEQEKFLIKDNVTQQAAKYIHGVGDGNSLITKVLGGAFGAGVISRVVRGYTFISRNYDPGDHIQIVGFSRGAYTARALGGLIASQGLLAKAITANKEAAYSKGAQAWQRFRGKSSASKPTVLAHLAEVISQLPHIIFQEALRDQDLVPVDGIASVAVWDTVGAMGFPEFASDGTRTDAFRFADTQLSRKVANGYHAVALDERRVDFMPTLWDSADNVTQVLFPGAHSDVGGGYPAKMGDDDGCNGLSDGALQWMMDRLNESGVQFSDPPAFVPGPALPGTAHKPWQHSPFNLPTVFKGARTFAAGLALHPSIQERIDAGDVIGEPGEAAAPYDPNNLPPQS